MASMVVPFSRLLYYWGGLWVPVHLFTNGFETLMSSCLLLLLLGVRLDEPDQLLDGASCLPARARVRAKGNR